MRILITGGHPAPALAVIKQLLKKKEKDIHFVGRQHARDGETAHSYEYKQISKLKLPFYNLTAGRLTRSFMAQTWGNIVRIFKGFVDARKLLNEIQPDVVLSFGGYLALPVCYMAKLQGIKVLTHEQTIAPGVANKLIGRIADRVLISFPETLKYFDVHKTRVVGNPIREEAIKKVKVPLKLPSSKPVLYVTGGSLGSHDINVHVENILGELLKKFIVIHQIGNVTTFGDFERLSKMKKAGYFPVEHFHSDEVGWVFKTADVVVSRSGANTTFELIALRKPAVLIPLPWSGSGEQEMHAKLIEQKGGGVVFDQSRPSEELYEAIIHVYENRNKHKKAYASLKDYVQKDAADKIIEEVMQ